MFYIVHIDRTLHYIPLPLSTAFIFTRLHELPVAWPKNRSKLLTEGKLKHLNPVAIFVIQRHCCTDRQCPERR